MLKMIMHDRHNRFVKPITFKNSRRSFEAETDPEKHILLERFLAAAAVASF
jgi:hypothetical protein